MHRRENPEDRRSQLVELSPQGRAAVARINKLCNGKYQALLGRLTAAERKKVLWGMERIAELLREDEENGEGGCCGS